MNHPTIYYIRHGQTDWNAELRYQGRRDIALNELGRRQALENGRKLGRIVGTGDRLRYLASPLGRARETMEIVLGQLGRDTSAYDVVPELVEASYGELEGRTLADFKARNPELHAQRRQNRWTFCPPGGESQEMVAKRVGAWLCSLEGDAVVAGHGVVGRVLRHLILELPKEEVAKFAFPQDVVFIWQDGQENRV